jgi:hypothetical protein
MPGRRSADAVHAHEVSWHTCCITGTRCSITHHAPTMPAVCSSPPAASCMLSSSTPAAAQPAAAGPPLKLADDGSMDGSKLPSGCPLPLLPLLFGLSAASRSSGSSPAHTGCIPYSVVWLLVKWSPAVTAVTARAGHASRQQPLQTELPATT